MAGFLSALIPVAQTLGPEMQIGAREAQRQSSQDAFGKLLDQLGPEAEPFRQYFKAGGTPAQVSSAMGGTIGQEIQQKYSVHRMGEIMGGGGDFKQNLITAAGEGLVPWKEVLTYLKDPTKAPPVMPEDLKANAKQFLASNPQIDQDERNYIQGAIDSDNYGALKSINDKVIPPYFGSTKYSTRGYTMTGTDPDGVPFTTRYEEPLRGGPAHVQSVYTAGPLAGQPVPQDKLARAKYTGSFADYGGGGFGDTSSGAPDYGAGAPAPGSPSGARPPAQAGGGGIPAAPSAPAPAPSGAGGLAPMTFGHLGQTEIKTGANINSLLPQLESLQRNMSTIGQDRWNRDLPTRVFAKWMAQHFDFLPGSDPSTALAKGRAQAGDFIANDKDLQQLQINDPDLAHVMSQLITVDAMASISLLASAGSRASNLLDEFKGHIMEPNGNFGSIMTNIQTLNASDGPYRSWLHTMKVRPATPDPPAYVMGRAGRGSSSAAAATSKMDQSDEDFMKKYYRK